MGKNVVMTLFCLSILAVWTGLELYMDRESAFEQEVRKVTVAADDTVWGIAGRLYRLQDRYRNFEEFIYYIRKENGMEKPFLCTKEEEAKVKKFIVPGDVLTITLYKRK